MSSEFYSHEKDSFCIQTIVVVESPFCANVHLDTRKKINFSGLALKCKVGKSMMSIFQFPNDMVE